MREQQGRDQVDADLPQPPVTEPAGDTPPIDGRGGEIADAEGGAPIDISMA